MSNATEQEFQDHVEYIDELLSQVKNDGLRTDLRAAIEGLVEGLAGDWVGGRITWSSPVPDNAASLFD